MPYVDTREILKIVKRRERKWILRKATKTSNSIDITTSESSKNSNSSVNKDWEN
jgi:hypothetical protein